MASKLQITVRIEASNPSYIVFVPVKSVILLLSANNFYLFFFTPFFFQCILVLDYINFSLLLICVCVYIYKYVCMYFNGFMTVCLGMGS